MVGFLCGAFYREGTASDEFRFCTGVIQMLNWPHPGKTAISCVNTRLRR